MKRLSRVTVTVAVIALLAVSVVGVGATATATAGPDAEDDSFATSNWLTVEADGSDTADITLTVDTTAIIQSAIDDVFSSPFSGWNDSDDATGVDDRDSGADVPSDDDDANEDDSDEFADDSDTDRSDGDTADDSADDTPADEPTGDDATHNDSSAPADDEDASSEDDAVEDDSHAAESDDDTLDRVLVERYVHQAVNEERTDRGLEALEFDDDLQEIARAHSEDMAERGYFAHVDPDGNTFEDRYAAHGYECRAYTGDGSYYTGGENLAMTYVNQPVQTDTGAVVEYTDERELADGIVDQWMNSDGHRENLLAEHWNNEGIGIHVTEDDEVYATQNFC
ncbi:CAP domain-containing protein [Natronolimnohabitans sp. A-GB9]|uniref:CAP domain-containing protein n=1 Tax=Natronolimnohabitans sp. A-GB9 TaxID=3069757 RepID=UPI0027AE506E|nr:CAP domain-containing protein [Natronolimnohabitans sp. A-GB9]MDQ2049898.1 CAP domain-containing protein [Natronolimnohabitans sp. A-GB9]